ncbi:MAG TPA: PAS domain S-box protein [Stellaceae bacterium]|nr:PAS domain S-box protein [Stellaceae bacterium]
MPTKSTPKGDDPINPSDSQHANTSSDRFELLVRAVTDYAIYFLRRDGTIASWNAGAERLKGYTEQEVIGRNFSLFFTLEDRAANKPATALKTAAATGRWEDEGWRVRKDGTRFWALAVLDAVHDRSGELIGFAKITRDMTERRLAQQALIDSERRFRLLVESVVDYALFTLDLKGNIQSWNPGAERLKGYTADEVIGKHFSIFYTEEARAAGEPAAVLAKTITEGRFDSEGWRVRKNGSRFWANIVIDPIRDETGQLIGFTKITRDISERRSLEQAKEQLFQAQKMETVGQLTGGVAHDFNNLLTAVSGSHSLLRPMISDPRAQRLLDTADRAVARAARLTQQLLAFSRQHRLQPERSNVNELITAFEGLLRHATDENIGLVLDLDPHLWFSSIDQTQFQSALLNLIVNARDAMEGGGGTVTIETGNVQLDQNRARKLGEIDAGPYVVIAVRDTGAGMPAEAKARAIEPFFTTKSPGKGSGLGLSQVYGFLRQSGGQIEIDSAVGEGTTVRMFLPRLVEAMTDEDNSATAPRLGSVLITEDDPDVLAIAVETLRSLGYEIYSAANAAEALTILKRGTPVDVLFSDIVMPGGMNGVELAREARRLRPGIRVLLSSGYSRQGLQPEEGTSFIPKPYQLPELARQLEAIITASSRAA